MGALFGVIVWRYGISWLTLLLLVAAWAAVVLSAIDIDVRRLPRAIVRPWGIVTAAIVVVAVVTSHSWWVGARSLIGAAALGVLYYGSWFAYRKGLGWGDVTVAPILGAILGFVGWPALAVGTFAGFVWGLLGAILPMLRARSIKGVKIPFGPWMMLGAATGVVLGHAISSWYLGKVIGL